MNRVTLSGRLTNDVDLRQTQNGKSVCSFSLAVSRGGKNDETDFFNIVAWENLAEFVTRHLGKGRKIIVEGKLRTRSYQDKQTQANVKVVEILADSIEFADSKPSGPFGNTSEQPYENSAQFNTGYNGSGVGYNSSGNPSYNGGYNR